MEAEMIQHSKKMEIFSPAIFGDLKKAANEKAKTGVKIIDLSLGSPDLPPNEKIRKTLSDASLQENMYGYTLTGTKSFNEAVSDYYKRRVNVDIEARSEEHTSELQSRGHLVCRLLLEKKKTKH